MILVGELAVIASSPFVFCIKAAYKVANCCCFGVKSEKMQKKVVIK